MNMDSHGYTAMKATDPVPGDEDFLSVRNADPKVNELLDGLE
jgi:hypothetical protein